MTSALTQIGPPVRLAGIESRLRGPSGGPASGPSFETLLAQATARGGDVRLASGVGTALRRGSPSGVLGSSSLGSEIAVATGGGATMAPLGTSAGQAVVDAAMTHLGVPYLWGGTDAEHGFDCSGLVQDAYRQIGVEMPKWSRHQATMGVEVDSIEQAMPGDVLAFGDPVNHVGLYVGDGRMLHAPRTGEVVKVEKIDRPIRSIRRVVTPAGGSLAASPVGGQGVGVTGGSGRSAVNRSEAAYTPLFVESGRRWNVDPALLAAVAQTESGFDPGAVSPAGAQGLMQFMPATAAEMDVDAFDPVSAVDGAARYLRQSLDQFGSVKLAVASYNAGRGAVSRHGGVPPYTETENYVVKVLDAWRARS